MYPLIGEIVGFAFNFDMENWEKCNGQLVHVLQYPALFALIDNKYGGDGKTKFALPNFPTDANGITYYISVSGEFPRRK